MGDYEPFIHCLSYANGDRPLFGDSWKPWLPILVTDPGHSGVFGSEVKPMPWLFDSGHGGLASSWIAHLYYGCSLMKPLQPEHLMPFWSFFRSAAGTRYRVLVRRAEIWLFSNLHHLRH